MKNLNIFVFAVAATLFGCDCQKKSCSAHEISKEAKVYHYFGSIADTLEIEKVHPRLKKAFDFLKRDDLDKIPFGTYQLDEVGADGKSPVFAIVQEANLVPFEGETQKAEVHKKYIDVQSPISGEETFGIASLGPDTPAYDFSVENDVGFMTIPTQPKTLKPGEFAVFMPQCGAHVPGRTLSAARKIRKVVVKVLAD